MGKNIQIPKKYWRFPTKEAVDNLSKQLDLPNEPNMQDWEWEVADPNKIKLFFNHYFNGNLSEDEKFTLMEVLLQSFEESSINLDSSVEWKEIMISIEKSWPLHRYSVWYWSCWEENEKDCWRISNFMKNIIENHKKEFL